MNNEQFLDHIFEQSRILFKSTGVKPTFVVVHFKNYIDLQRNSMMNFCTSTNESTLPIFGLKVYRTEDIEVNKIKLGI